jgi:hypothetical protein
MQKAELVAKAYSDFSCFAKPNRLTKYDDDDLDCRDHERTLKELKREALSIREIGPVSWSPIPFLNAEAMAYYLPRLIEFAVDNVNDIDGDPFAIRFIDFVVAGPKGEQFASLTEVQIGLVFQTLLYIKSHYDAVIRFQLYSEDLDAAIVAWTHT